FLAVALLLPHGDLRPGDLPQRQTTPDLADPGSDAFFAFTVDEDLSHVALFHDLAGTIDAARRAYILLIGNSRAQLGWREDVIQREAQALGLEVFNLAVGHGETAQFALDVIRRHDLRPRVMIVSGGPFIYSTDRSAWAETVQAMGGWEARKRFFENTAAWHIRAALHWFVPRLDYHGVPLTGGWVHYRSARTGWWRNALEPDNRYPVAFFAEPASHAEPLAFARMLQAEAGSRGAMLVLTMVPYGNTQSAHVRVLADALGVPAIVPSFEGQETADGSHLHRDSAVRASREFWEAFVRHPVIRSQLALEPIQSRTTAGVSQ
ncbi:MAG: hypothetical protein AAGE01_24155, partial [Pseudomonadota bacterium]